MHIFYEFHNFPIIFFKDKGLVDVPHLHQHIELIYLRKGDVTVDHLNRSYLLNEGDIFLALPNFTHKFINNNQGDDLDVDVLLFNPQFFGDFHVYFHKKFLENPIFKKEHLHEDVAGILSSMTQGGEMLNIARESNLFLLYKSYISVLMAHILPLGVFLEDSSHYSGDIMIEAIKFIMANYRDPINLDSLSKELGVSKSHISRTFNSKIDMGFSSYLNTMRVEHAKELLSTTDQSITEIGEHCGYETHRTFNREFKKITGMNPRKYREDNKVFYKDLNYLL